MELVTRFLINAKKKLDKRNAMRIRTKIEKKIVKKEKMQTENEMENADP